MKSYVHVSLEKLIHAFFVVELKKEIKMFDLASIIININMSMSRKGNSRSQCSSYLDYINLNVVLHHHKHVDVLEKELHDPDALVHGIISISIIFYLY